VARQHQRPHCALDGATARPPSFGALVALILTFSHRGSMLGSPLEVTASIGRATIVLRRPERWVIHAVNSGVWHQSDGDSG
jgi:hypothetical protein